MHNRRAFIKQFGAGAAGLAALGLTPWDIWANPLKILEPRKSLRINGRVTARGKGLAGVAVTDGFNLVQTGSDGTYELISSTRQDYVYMSLPAGYQIPRQQNGSAAFFEKLDKTREESSISFDLEPLEQSDSTHHFLVLADTQIQNDYEAGRLLNEAAPDVLETVRGLNDPNTFGIGCGDLVFDQFHLFKEYNEAVQKTGVPFFQVLGNHDMDTSGIRSDELSTATFNSHFGPTYYSFNRGEVHYVMMDDVFFIGKNRNYIGYLTEEQLTWLERDLQLVEPGSTVVVAVHIPLITGAPDRYPNENFISGTVNNREQLYKLLEPFKAHVMSGHTHFNDNMPQGNLYEHCHGTVCGAWWSGPICSDGTPNGYGVYSVNGSELSWRYKSTGKPAEHQFRIYQPGKHPRYPEFHSVNLWNWDKDWTLTWYEDGIRKGEMLRITATDPLSIGLHTGSELPERRPWVEPTLNDHMFFFKPDPSASRLVVEATDPFGNVYKETVKG